MLLLSMQYVVYYVLIIKLFCYCYADLYFTDRTLFFFFIKHSVMLFFIIIFFNLNLMHLTRNSFIIIMEIVTRFIYTLIRSRSYLVKFYQVCCWHLICLKESDFRKHYTTYFFSFTMTIFFLFLCLAKSCLFFHYYFFFICFVCDCHYNK